MKPGFLWDTIRSFFSLFDRIVYELLIGVYELFFNVSKQEIFPDSTIVKFFDRIFLIIGIFMLFKLAISLLNSIVNPDALTDKEKGFGKIITRVITAVIMLTLLMPTGDKEFRDNLSNSKIDDATKETYDYKIKTHGLLFGTLYTFQDRVLKENTIGKIILGSPKNTSEQQTEMKTAGSEMATTVLSAFFRPNPECGTKEFAKDLDDFMLKLNADNCRIDGKKAYEYTYMPIISTLAGGALLFIVFTFTLDVAVRAIKLSVLRLISPIPVISYIDPKSQKDGAFAGWLKNMISTYIDLFLRLALIYFGIFLVSEVCKNMQKVLPASPTFIDVLTQVIIIIGIFLFVKMAPKFIKDVFGIKGGSGSVGMAGLLGGAAALVGGAGLAGAGAAMMSNINGVAEAAGQGKQFSGGWAAGRDLAAQIRTGDSKAKGGIVNRMQQGAVQRANRNAARRLGLTQDTVDRAKANMFDAQAEAAKRKDMYNRFVKGQDFSDRDKSDYASARGWQYDPGSGDYYDENGHLLGALSDTQIREDLYNDMAAAETAAGKAESNYKKADKEWSSRGLDSSFVDDNSPEHFHRARRAGAKVYDKVKGAGAWEARSAQRESDRAARQSANTDRIVDRSKDRGGFDPNKR